LLDPKADKKVLLRDLAVEVVKETVKDAVEAHVLNFVVERAYGALCVAKA